LVFLPEYGDRVPHTATSCMATLRNICCELSGIALHKAAFAHAVSLSPYAKSRCWDALHLSDVDQKNRRATQDA